MPDFLFGCKVCGHNVTVQVEQETAPPVLCDTCDRLMACRGRHQHQCHFCQKSATHRVKGLLDGKLHHFDCCDEHVRSEAMQSNVDGGAPHA